MRNKLYSNTILEPLANLRQNLEQRDTLLIANQSIRWTAKELDVINLYIYPFQTHSDAFAYYLIESGYKPGNKMLFWADINHSAEIITSMVEII